MNIRPRLINIYKLSNVYQPFCQHSVCHMQDLDYVRPFDLTKSRSRNGYSDPSLSNLTNVSAAISETSETSMIDRNGNIPMRNSSLRFLYLCWPSKPFWHGIHCRDYSGWWLIGRQGQLEPSWMRLWEGLLFIYSASHKTWWRHDIENFSALLDQYSRFPRSVVDSPHKGWVIRSFGVLFVVKWLSRWTNNGVTTDSTSLQWCLHVNGLSNALFLYKGKYLKQMGRAHI